MSQPDGRQLIEAGRKAFRPTLEDRERVLQALRARLPGEAGNPGGPTAPAAPAAKGIGWLGASAAATVGLAIGAALLLSWPDPETRQSPALVSVGPRTAPAVNAPQVEPPPAALAASSLPAAPVAPAERASSTRRASDRLAEEVAILSRAESERHAGRFSSALGVLEEHRRKFPRGALAQERMAARVRVLCGLGRTSEAEAELATLKRASPTSVHLQARTACAAK